MRNKRIGCGCGCIAIIVVILITIAIMVTTATFSGVGVLKNMYKFSEQITTNVQDVEVYAIKQKDVSLMEKENIIDYGEVLNVIETTNYILVEATKGNFAISENSIGSALKDQCVLIEVNNENIVVIENDEIVFPDKIYVYPKNEIIID